jgi:hypothetical protein
MQVVIPRRTARPNSRLANFQNNLFALKRLFPDNPKATSAYPFSVSVRGLLFIGTPNPVLVANKDRTR